MIIIDLIYLAIYSFFRRFYNKYSFDVPETVALFLMGFLNGFSGDILYYISCRESNSYSKETGLMIFVTGILATLLLYFRYRNKNYEKYYLKYKSYLLIPGILVFVWMYFIYKYLKIILFI